MKPPGVILTSLLLWTFAMAQFQQPFQQQFNQQPFQFQQQQQPFQQQQFQQFPQTQYPMGVDQDILDLLEMNRNPEDSRYWKDRRASEGRRWRFALLAISYRSNAGMKII